MRRILGMILIGLCGFLLVTAALSKFYAYPTLANVPIDQKSVTHSVGHQMTYFDKGTLSEATDTLTSTIRVVGDVKAAQDHGNNVAVWDESTITENTAHQALAVDTKRIAFDRTTGVGVNCCGQKSDKSTVPMTGQLVKFPFNTQQHDYQWWDDDLKKTVTMKYQGTEKIGGLTVYHFHEQTAPAKTGTLAVPAGLLGAGGGMANAEEWYSNERDYWAEPETGALVKVIERPNTTLRYQGVDKLTVTKGTTGFPLNEVNANVKDYTTKGGQLKLVRSTLPLLGLVVGLLALVIGTLLLVGGRRADGESSDEAVDGAGSGDDGAAKSDADDSALTKT